jgi:hypothetical protein
LRKEHHLLLFLGMTAMELLHHRVGQLLQRVLEQLKVLQLQEQQHLREM